MNPRRNLQHALLFLAPNFLGFLAFTLFPVLFSLVMVFTSWTLKPSVPTKFVGLRNLSDLLGVRTLGEGNSLVGMMYLGCVLVLVATLVGTLWSQVARWPGARAGGAVLGLTGVTLLVGGLLQSSHHSVLLAGLALVVAGVAGACQDDDGWRFGRGTIPAILFGVALLGLTSLNGTMWSAYEPRDARFWQYF